MKELIELAKETGFEPKSAFDLYSNLKTGDNIFLTYTEIDIYLYLCELKKWLMDEHKILVIVDTFGIPEACYYQIWINDELEEDPEDFNKPYESAMFEGLKKALTLI